MQSALHPVHGDNTKGELVGLGGSFSTQESGAELGEGRAEIKHVFM